MKFKGIYSGLIVRRHRIVDRFEIKNAVVDVALDHILSTQFLGGAQSASWYIGLLASGATLSIDDTMASHPGWTENTNYDEATRPQWQAALGPLPGVAYNALYADFTMNASLTLDGIFVVDDNQKALSTGNLWSTAKFNGGSKNVNPGDIVRVRYALYAERA